MHTPRKSGVEVTFNLVLVSLMVALIIISARLSIALGPVPVTLQTLVVVLCGLLLGPGLGLLPPLLYLLMGLIGFPVFATGGGIAYIFRPTFGFLLGFIPAAGLAGLIFKGNWARSKYLKAAVGSIAALILIYLTGFGYIPFSSKFFGSDIAVLSMILPGLPFMLLGDLLKTICLVTIAPVVTGELEKISVTLRR